jgi:uncharacterized membrane protein
MRYFLIAAAVLHAGFMAAELFPWRSPLLLRIASEKLSPSAVFTEEQQRLVATIVHNAGIYNGILAGGMLWAALAGIHGNDVARVMLIGAGAAGVFGTITLKSPATAIQAAVGISGLYLLSVRL